jgi:hypothetical protein
VAITPILKPTSIVYTGDTTADYHDTANVSGTLTDSNSGQPVAAAKVKFTIVSQTCEATTDNSGHAACPILLNQTPGNTAVVASFKGLGLELPSETSAAFTITREETTLTYTGDVVVANNTTAHLSSVLLEDVVVPIQGRMVA